MGKKDLPGQGFLWPCPSQPGTVPKLQDSVQGIESHQSGVSERSGSTRSWQNQPSGSVRQSGALTHTWAPFRISAHSPHPHPSFRELEDKSRPPNLCSKLQLLEEPPPEKAAESLPPPPCYQIPGQDSQAYLRSPFAPRLWVELGAGKDCPCLPQDSHPARLGESHCSAQTQLVCLQAGRAPGNLSRNSQPGKALS